jgi:hypothetical protein
MTSARTLTVMLVTAVVGLSASPAQAALTRSQMFAIQVSTQGVVTNSVYYNCA